MSTLFEGSAKGLIIYEAFVFLKFSGIHVDHFTILEDVVIDRSSCV